MKPVKVMCPECKEVFEIDKNMYDEGDLVECPECSAILTVTIKNGKLVLASQKERYFEDEGDEEDEGEEE